MDANIKKYCPNCSQLYVLNPKGNNLPLFLSCGHSMCEKCIRNIVKFGEPIECKVCHRDMAVEANDVTLLTQNKMNLHKLFPVNFQMLGELYLQFIEAKQDTAKDSNADCFVDLKAILKSVDSAQGECLECHGPTSKMCQQCATNLCDTCFNKSHKNFVIFKNHFLKNIGPISEPNDCKTHKGKPLDYYCKDCLKSVCMDCMMVGGANSCKNHDVVSMQEVNEEFIEELSELSPKVDETFRRLTKTAVDIGHLLYNIENETESSCEHTQMIAEIEQHFSKLNSQIQKRKQELIDTVAKLKSSEKESLRKAKKDVSEAIKRAKIVLNSLTNTSDPKLLKETNLSVLLENAKEIANTPWYLFREEIKDNHLRVIVNEDIYGLVEDYVCLEGNGKSDYKLCTTAELGEDIEIPPPPPTLSYPPELPKDVRQSNKPKVEKQQTQNKTQPPYVAFYKSAPHYRNKSESVSSLNSISSDSSYRSSVAQNESNQKPVIQTVMPFAESHHPKQLHEGATEIIYISHIVDPHNFYVQRSCHQSLVKEMMREFRNAVSLPKPSLSHVAEGKIYLVYNKADSMWQRCRIISIDRKNINNPVFHVFCIDFGSTESVSIDNLRLIPPARLQSPFPLAINCSLANCEPKAGNWTSDDAFLIRNIIDNKQAVIYVRHIRSTSDYTVKLDCDVTTFEDGISLAHALVFHERARMPNPKLPYPNIMCTTEKPKLFMSCNDMKPKTVEEVCITHIVSPDKFFVRKHHLQDVYEKLCEELELEYSLSDNNGSIYLPEVGMVCVMNLEKYRSSVDEGAGVWARAVVTELHGRGRVRLLLPDIGVTVLVHWTALRRIQNKFTVLRALAIECHLAGVSPLNKKWSTGSVTLLQKFENRWLELIVEENRSSNSLGVTLYDKADEDNIICVNSEMIKHKFAVTFGMFMFHKDKSVENQVITNKSPLQPKKPSKPEAVNKKISILQKEKAPKKKIKEKDLNAKDKGPLRLEAKILHYQSPSLLYVSLITQQKVFMELFEKMQQYYANNKKTAKEDWKVGDRCCTICIQSQTWRRAVILEIEGSNVKVFYSDFACVETVPMSSLRELTPDFAKIGDAAIKCHLCGVIPAVGEEWPSLTKEYLKELLDAYKRIFITKLGNFKDKSMPIEIWVYHTIQGDALEPNKSEWRCLNRKIIEQGLGIPDKAQETTVTDTSGVGDDEMLSFLNVTGSVSEWLQLEPLPIKPVTQKSDSGSGSSPPSPAECEEHHEITDGSNTVFITDWLPPEPLVSKEFAGIPTYIDNDGIIYLHDISQQDTLDLIRKSLDVRFKDPDPKVKYTRWTVGEPCIALFFLDNRFYRGRVMEVNNEASTCLIHYVDYGNEEVCSFANLRKSTALYPIPIQAHKCILNRIQPVGGRWDRQTLDYIHKSIVEKMCFIKITGEPIGDLIPIDLKYDKLWINDLLVDFEMAVYTDGSKAVVRKFLASTSPKKVEENIIFESDSGPDYIVEDEDGTPQRLSTSRDSFNMESLEGKDWNKLLEDEEKESLEGKYIIYPKESNEEFRCNITVINDMNKLELNIIHDDETALVYENLYADIQKAGENMNPINGIFENKACVAIFPEDNQWYRATVLEYSEVKNLIKVRYVDYGNIEVVSIADVREIDEEWAKLPPATITAKLHGIQLNPDINMNLIADGLSSTFLDKGPFNVKVISYDDTVPLVELRNDDGELVYDNLIKEGIFLKIK